MMKVKKKRLAFLKTKKKVLKQFFINGVKKKVNFAIKKYGRKKFKNMKCKK